MCSIDIFAVVIVLLLILLIIHKSAVSSEFLVSDHRPHAYLIYSADPTQCKDCDDLADRFLLSVGRRDRYIAHMWETSVAKQQIATFAKKHNMAINVLPTLVIVYKGMVQDVHEGTEIIRLAMRDMV